MSNRATYRYIRTDFPYSWSVSRMSSWQPIPGPAQHTLEGSHPPSGTGTCPDRLGRTLDAPCFPAGTAVLGDPELRKIWKRSEGIKHPTCLLSFLHCSHSSFYALSFYDFRGPEVWVHACACVCARALGTQLVQRWCRIILKVISCGTPWLKKPLKTRSWWMIAVSPSICVCVWGGGGSHVTWWSNRLWLEQCRVFSLYTSKMI